MKIIIHVTPSTPREPVSTQIQVDGQPGPIEFEVPAEQALRERELVRAARAVLATNEDWMEHPAEPQTIERLHRAFEDLRAALRGTP